MNDNIKQLLMSESNEDIELGCVLARKTGVKAREVELLPQERFSWSTESWHSARRWLTFSKYLLYSSKNDVFYAWRRKEQ